MLIDFENYKAIQGMSMNYYCVYMMCGWHECAGANDNFQESLLQLLPGFRGLNSGCQVHTESSCWPKKCPCI